MVIVILRQVSELLHHIDRVANVLRRHKVLSYLDAAVKISHLTITAEIFQICPALSTPRIISPEKLELSP